MKNIILLIGLTFALTASAQYWTTNTTVTTTTNLSAVLVNPTGTNEYYMQTNLVVSVTNEVVIPIMVTNNVNVKFVTTAEAAANIRAVFDELKDDGQVTGSFGAWVDDMVNAAASQAFTTKSGELSAVKTERILRLWSRATLAQQTNVVNLLK